MLDTTKDLGHPAFIKKKNSPFLLEAALEVLEELRKNFREVHGKRKVLSWWKKNPQTNEPNKNNPQHLKKQLHLCVLALKPQESLSYLHVSVEHILKTLIPLNPASVQSVICQHLSHLFNACPLLCDTFHHSVLYYLIIARKISNLCTKLHFSHMAISTLLLWMWGCLSKDEIETNWEATFFCKRKQTI